MALACAIATGGSDVGAGAVVRAATAAADRLIATRPTAVNLAWGVDRVLAAARTAARTGAGAEGGGAGGAGGGGPDWRSRTWPTTGRWGATAPPSFRRAPRC